KDLEQLVMEENLERTTLAKKVMIKGLKKERFKFADQKYILKGIFIERAAKIIKLSLFEI
ncbi:MAG: hypothetical protein ACTSVV_02485, partial [Promethearchaeota archaeon]